MNITFTKGSDKDFINITRDDGTNVDTTFPKKGWYPHDAVHVIVESFFDLENGFWGLIESGMDPQEVGELAKNAGHASAKRADIPEEHIIDLIIAERIVECYEAELWSGQSDIATFKSVLEAACQSSHVNFPKVDDDMISSASLALKKSANDWKALDVGQSMSMNWPNND